MIPHERSLVERYKNRPFVILGVNTDSDKDQYRRLARENNVTWRSAWEGRRGGELSKLFQIKGYPTLFLLDPNGNVAKVWTGNPGERVLDAEIEKLVVAAEASGRK